MYSANCRSEASYCKLRKKAGINVKYIMLDQNYTTVSPVSVDGWLGLMIGLELWTAMWDESMIEAAAAQIANDMSNSGIAAGPPMEDKKQPMDSPPAKTAPVVGARDLEKAWSCLTSSQNEKVHALLKEYDVTNPSLLEELDSGDLMALAALLGKATRRGFLKAMNLKEE